MGGRDNILMPEAIVLIIPFSIVFISEINYSTPALTQVEYILHFIKKLLTIPSTTMKLSF